MLYLHPLGIDEQGLPVPPNRPWHEVSTQVEELFAALTPMVMSDDSEEVVAAGSAALHVAFGTFEWATVKEREATLAVATEFADTLSKAAMKWSERIDAECDAAVDCVCATCWYHHSTITAL